MATEDSRQGTAESQLKRAQEERELLLVQIHQLEEELEHYFKKNQESERGEGGSGNRDFRILCDDDELIAALAEIQRLQALVEVLRKKHQIETQNSLNSKLGSIMIERADSPRNLVTIPGAIGKIWWASSRNKPPKVLGGKSFEKVIAAYYDGGFKAVEDLLDVIPYAFAMQANGYTALARNLMKSDPYAAAEAARRAYEIDPKPFRLKWLAFKLHAAGAAIEAEAMLDILPPDVNFSESESRQAQRLCSEAKQARKHEAIKKSGYSNQPSKVALLTQLSKVQKDLEKQYIQSQTLKQEKKENELLLNQLSKVQEELEEQYIQCQVLKQEKTALLEQIKELGKLVADCQAQLAQKEANLQEGNEKQGFLATDKSRKCGSTG